VDKLKGKIRELEWALGRKTLEAEILKQTLENSGIKKGGGLWCDGDFRGKWFCRD
jgi:hypothetical protein